MLRRAILLIALLAIPLFAQAGPDRDWRASYADNPTAMDALADFDAVIETLGTRLREMHANGEISEDAAKQVIKTMRRLEARYMNAWFGPEGKFAWQAVGEAPVAVTYSKDYRAPVAGTTTAMQISADVMELHQVADGEAIAYTVEIEDGVIMLNGEALEGEIPGMHVYADALEMQRVATSEPLAYTVELEDGIIMLNGEEIDVAAFSEGVFMANGEQFAITERANGEQTITITTTDDDQKTIEVEVLVMGEDGVIWTSDEGFGAYEVVIAGDDPHLMEIYSDGGELINVDENKLIYKIVTEGDESELIEIYSEGAEGEMFDVYKNVEVIKSGDGEGEYVITIVGEDGEPQVYHHGEMGIAGAPHPPHSPHAGTFTIPAPGHGGPVHIAPPHGAFTIPAPQKMMAEFEGVIKGLVESGDLTKKGAEKLLKAMEQAHSAPHAMVMSDMFTIPHGEAFAWHGEGDVPHAEFWKQHAEGCEGKECPHGFLEFKDGEMPHGFMKFDGNHGAHGYLPHGEGGEVFIDKRMLSIVMDDDGNITVNGEGFSEEELAEVLEQVEIHGDGAMLFMDGENEYFDQQKLMELHGDIALLEMDELMLLKELEGLEEMEFYFQGLEGVEELELKELEELELYFQQLESDDELELKLDELLERVEELLEKLEELEIIHEV